MKPVKRLLRYKYKAPPPTLQVWFDGAVVAELTKEKDKFSFRYLDAFAEKKLPALPGLPLGMVTKTSELPPYFAERLPDTRRPDIRQWMKESGVSEQDMLMMLATLGAHTITDAFELRLRAA